jgi:hypothetical protein
MPVTSTENAPSSVSQADSAGSIPVTRSSSWFRFLWPCGLGFSDHTVPQRSPGSTRPVLPVARSCLRRRWLPIGRSPGRRRGRSMRPWPRASRLVLGAGARIRGASGPGDGSSGCGLSAPAHQVLGRRDRRCSRTIWRMWSASRAPGRPASSSSTPPTLASTAVRTWQAFSRGRRAPRSRSTCRCRWCVPLVRLRSVC